MGIYSSKGLPCQLVGKVTVGIILCIIALFYGSSASAATATVCYKTGSELDLDKTINANPRAKLANPAYFGPAGTAAPETLIFTTMATVTASTLVSNGCDIFYGGGSPALSLAEATDVQNWTQSAVDRFVLAGCDYSWNRICSVFGRGLTGNSNGGITIVSGGALSFNALGCGGALTVATFGGASTYHGTLPGDIIMATHNGAPAGQTAAVITDGAVNSSTFLFSADADMYGSSGSAAIGAGAIARTDQAKFVGNSFKYALDVVQDRMDNPMCVDSYDDTTDLAIASSLASTTLSVGQQTTITFTVSNQSTTTTSSIAAELILPPGLSYVSQSGAGTYNSGTNAWAIGAIAGGASVSITLTVQAVMVSVSSITGEITNANLADVDSATNSSFGADDKADGIIDDDETTEAITITEPVLEDYGDAPDSYGTTDASGGAKHSVSNDIYLGATKPDPDADGVPGLAANSDDTNAGGDDEDGVATLPILSHLDNSYSTTVNATNNTTNPARLIAWIDFDGNGIFDNDEAAVRTIPSGTTAGSFTINWSSIPSDIQQGNTYLRLRFTTDGINAGEAKGAKLDGEVEDYAMTITSSGANVTGRVYIDANSSASEDVGEAGIGSTVVVLYDTLGATCQSVLTDANGDYSFSGIPDGEYEVYQSHGDTTPIPQSCGSSFATNPTGYQSTTADILSLMVLSADVVDKDFGEVAGANSPTSGNTGTGILFEPDHQSEVLPGNVAFYAHTFSTEADGNVSFTTADGGNSASGWTHTLYQDSDCNGTLNGNEGSAAINGTLFSLTAGNRLCLIDKVYAPANVPAQDPYQVEITATFDYAGGNLPPVTLEVSDLTIAGETVSPTTSTAPAVGESRLVLRKSVENLTQGTPETESLNQANPGDFLKYRIYYRNTGTGPITDLLVDDTVPVYTGLVTGSNTCDTTPAGMTCSANINIDELNWNFTGSLIGGVSGHVSYEVTVDN